VKINQKDKNIFKKIIWILSLFIVVVLLIFIFKGQKIESNKSSAVFSKATVNIDDKNLEAWFADNDQSRTQGLAGVRHLNDDQGMLFEFDNTESYGIWMKGMLIPIDILWFDAYGHVVAIENSVDPSTYPMVFRPKDIHAKYVLELRAGYVLDNNIKKGDTMTFLKS
jgi:uncharacterized membrane protein (UPF0127 family)